MPAGMKSVRKLSKQKIKPGVEITLNDTHIHNKNPIFETLYKYH
jgi:hypothetical protein